jgi:hypothetical protein
MAIDAWVRAHPPPRDLRCTVTAALDEGPYRAGPPRVEIALATARAVSFGTVAVGVATVGAAVTVDLPSVAFWGGALAVMVGGRLARARQRLTIEGPRLAVSGRGRDDELDLAAVTSCRELSAAAVDKQLGRGRVVELATEPSRSCVVWRGDVGQTVWIAALLAEAVTAAGGRLARSD